MKKCPNCDAELLDAAIACRDCGKSLTGAPAAGGAEVAPRVPGGVVLAVVAVILGIVFVVDHLPSDTTPVQVTYRVTGRLADNRTPGYTFRGSMTFASPGGGTQQVGVADLPWTYTSAEFTGAEFLYIAAQNQSEDDFCIKVEILKNDAPYKTAESCGPHVIATVSGIR